MYVSKSIYMYLFTLNYPHFFIVGALQTEKEKVGSIVIFFHLLLIMKTYFEVSPSHTPRIAKWFSTNVPKVLLVPGFEILLPTLFSRQVI